MDPGPTLSALLASACGFQPQGHKRKAGPPPADLGEFLLSKHVIEVQRMYTKSQKSLSICSLKSVNKENSRTQHPKQTKPLQNWTVQTPADPMKTSSSSWGSAEAGRVGWGWNLGFAATS